MTLGRISFVIAAAALLAVVTEGAERALCSSPLHVVRRVGDSISGRKATVDEYCEGNRLVSVSGANVTIVDRDRGEIVEIRKGDATWSVSTFTEVAAANEKRRAVLAASAEPMTLKSTALSADASARATEAYAAERTAGGTRVRIEIAVDRRTALSRDALEAIIGATYPNRRSEIHDAVIAAASPVNRGRAAAMAEPLYALPVDEVVTIEAEGERVVSRSSVVAVDTARVPPELLVIPPGSTRVESNLTRFAKELEQLDRPATRP